MNELRRELQLKNEKIFDNVRIETLLDEKK